MAGLGIDGPVAKRSSTRPTLAIVIAVAVASAVFLSMNTGAMTKRFGYSHDGYNGAMWSIGADAIETDGLIKSRLGGKNSFGTYANHPPAIYVETYLSRRLPIDSHPAARLVPVISSLLALGLLAALLRELKFSDAALAASLLLVATSPMFTVFGSMLDTPILGLPI